MTQREDDIIPHQDLVEQIIAERLASETRIPGDEDDCFFVSTWTDDAPGDPAYGFLVTRNGDICNACGYVTGKAVGAGASDSILAIPPAWAGGAGVATPVCLSDNSVVGGINLDNDGEVIGIALAPGVALLITDTLQINFTWAIRRV